MLTKLFILMCLLTAGMIAAQPRVDHSESNAIALDSDFSHGRKTYKADEEIRNLRARVRTLENISRRLQDEIRSIRDSQGSKQSAWYCSAKSSFKRSYAGRGTTQLEAKSTALESCQKAESIHCQDDKIECEKEV